MKFFVSVKTNTKKTEVSWSDKKHLVVRLKESPVGGKANRALVEAVADFFNIPPSRVTIASGLKSKKKIIQIK